MRKNIILLRLLFFILLSLILVDNYAQTGINFQGVARTSNNMLIVSQPITIKLSILQSISTNNIEYSETKRVATQSVFTGNVEYSEIRKVTTNAQGLFTLVIGDDGALSTLGNFSNIDWKQTPKFLKIEIDPEAGNNFTTMGTTQFQYVAYAKYASSVLADNILGVVPVARGGTGASSLSSLKATLAIDNINNTADSLKPISKLAQTALDLKLNASDTGKYTKKTFSDSALQIKLNIADSTNGYITPTNLSNRINQKADYFDLINANSNISANTLSITAEITRATAVEKQLENNITTSISSATSSITSLTNLVNANTNSITSLTTSIAAATDKNIPNTIVKRDASGNFFAATISAQSETISGTLAIGGTLIPNPSAKLDISSTTQGFLPPRMTNIQRDAIVNPAQGLMIYCINCGTDGEPEYYNGSKWVNLMGAETKSQLPVVTTTNINSYSITPTSGGTITSGENITAAGICWSTSPGATITGTNKTDDFNKISGGTYTSTLTGLSPATKYYVRAYATNSVGTSYGPEINFISTPVIWSNYQGGKVFYLLKNNDRNYKEGEVHGLIVTGSVLSNGINRPPIYGIQWVNGGLSGSQDINLSTINTNKEIGFGMDNTNAIIKVLGPPSDGIPYAAYAAKNYKVIFNGVTYEDWFLPSANELYELMVIKLPFNTPFWNGTNMPYSSSILIDYSTPPYNDFVPGKHVWFGRYNPPYYSFPEKVVPSLDKETVFFEDIMKGIVYAKVRGGDVWPVRYF